MAKRIKAPKIKKRKAEEESKISINNEFDEKEDEGMMSVNMAMEKENDISEEDDQDIIEAYHEEEVSMMEEEEEETLTEDTKEEEEEPEEETIDLAEIKQKKAEEEGKSQGIKIPVAKANRDPKKDKDPIEGEDLGLVENDFLLSRKVSKEDLEIHNKMSDEALLGSNERKPKDFMNVFSRGPSTKEQPKVDTSVSIENNALIQKEVAAKQLLRNYHSKDNKEKDNTNNILTELKLDEEIIKEIKEDKKAYQNENLIEILKELL
jgi:hypothetical protein